MNLKEIREKAWKEEEDFFSREVIRPISHILTWLFVKLGISANTTACLKLALSASGLILLGLGGYVNMVVGALLLVLGYILDRVDGDIARVVGRDSKLGAYVDSLSDYIVDILLPVALGCGLANSTQTIFEPHIYIYIGLTFTLFRIIRRHATLLAQQIFASRPTSLMKRGVFFKLGALLYYVEYFILFISALSGLLEFFLFLYTAIEIAGTIVFIRAAVVGGGKEQNVS